MAGRNDRYERLERLMNQLSESVLGLSDEAIAEISDAGADPQQEAERTRLLLRQASKTLDIVNKRLSSLGHTINLKDWHRGQWGYHNHCVDCGSFVSFATATGEMRGDGFKTPCSSGVYPMSRREASR